MRFFAFMALALVLCAAHSAFAPPIVRLRYVVQPVELEFWERSSLAAHYAGIAREVFRLVNASPRVVTEVLVKVGRFEFPACFLGFDSLEVVVEKFDARANISYVFANFTLACRRRSVEYFEWLTRWADEPVEIGEYVFWLSKTFTRPVTVTVDPVTGDVRDAETGAPLGEWIFQLRRWELGLNSTVVLAGWLPIEGEGREGIDGIATIVYVNFSQSAGRDYVLNDGKVVVGSVRTAVGTSLYSRSYAVFSYGLPPGITVEEFKRLLPPGSRFVDFGNGTYAVVSSYIYDTYEVVKGFKPWTLKTVRREQSYAGLPPLVEVVGLVEYGAVYEVTPMLSMTLVYDRVTGVLLEAIPGLPEIPWMHMDHVPSPVSSYFGASWWRVLSGGPLALKLVESSLHRLEMKLGGVGRVDPLVHAAVVASAALIVLLQVGKRLVRG